MYVFRENCTGAALFRAVNIGTGIDFFSRRHTKGKQAAKKKEKGNVKKRLLTFPHIIRIVFFAETHKRKTSREKKEKKGMLKTAFNFPSYYLYCFFCCVECAGTVRLRSCAGFP